MSWRGRGGGRGTTPPEQNKAHVTSSGKTGRGGSASGLDIKKEKQAQSPRPTNRPLVYPTEEDRKRALQGVNRKIPVKQGSNQKLQAIGKEKEEDISKELQTLAQELSITEESPQGIIQAACRKAKELEELKKVVFSVEHVNGKEHDKEKTKAKIQDLHRCQEDLTTIKTAVMNPNKKKDFKLTQSTEEVVERIDTLYGQEDLTMIKTAVMNPNKSKDFKLTQSTEEVVERINALHGEIQNLKETTTKDQTKGRAKELESNLEELKKVVFAVEKVKDKEHDIKKTKAKIQDLQRCQEDLTRIKTALMNPNKNKDFKLTQSTEEVVERIDTLHSSQEDLTMIKTALMNPNKNKDFKLTQSTEEVVERINALHGEIQNLKETTTKDQTKGRAKELESNLEELKKVVFAVKKVKDKEHDLEETKAKIQDLQSCEKELTVIKTAVMNPNISKDVKLTHSTEEVVERINTLHCSQEGLTLIKTAVMNPDKSRDFKLTQSTEDVVERINALHGIEHDCLELKAIIFNKELRKIASCDKLDDDQRTVENAEKIAAELTSLYKKMKTDQKMLCIVILGKNEQPNMEKALNTVQFLKKAADESKDDIQKKKAELEQMEKEIDLLKKHLKETENKQQTLLKTYQEREQKLRNDLKEVKSQKENALTRLSEVAGAKLTESNPLITDLSDPNRPEKIGEQFSELYDNLWTDVFEQLSGTCKLSDRDSIQTLLQILEDSYCYCKDISSKRYSNTLAELTLWKLVKPKETPSKAPNKKEKNTPEKKKDADTKETTVDITLEELQKLQTLLVSPSSSSPADSKAVDSILAKIGLNVTSLSNIKKMLKSSLEGTSVIVQESFWKQRSEDPSGQREVLECTKPFLMKCVHICWLMVGQDPPVYLRFSDKCKDKFNKDIYREYTASGKMLDFVVWPAIFLHENGPLLKKGVAQPISKK